MNPVINIAQYQNSKAASKQGGNEAIIFPASPQPGSHATPAAHNAASQVLVANRRQLSYLTATNNRVRIAEGCVLIVEGQAIMGKGLPHISEGLSIRVQGCGLIGKAQPRIIEGLPRIGESLGIRVQGRIQMVTGLRRIMAGLPRIGKGCGIIPSGFGTFATG